MVFKGGFLRMELKSEFSWQTANLSGRLYRPESKFHDFNKIMSTNIDTG